MTSQSKIRITANGENDSSRFSIKIRFSLKAPVISYRKPTKMLVIGDVGGDFSHLRNMLLHYGVIDDRYKWIFGEGHLVVLGNCLSEKDTKVECLWLLYALEGKALKNGGMLHFILGSEEIQNMNGPWRIMHPPYVTNKGYDKKYSILYDGNSELYRWLMTKNVMEQIGDLLFMQIPIPIKQNTPVDTLEIHQASVKKWIRESATFNEVLTWDDLLISRTLEHFGVRHIVTGTPVVPRISIADNGRLIQVHTAGMKEALLIEEQVYYRLTVKGEKERLK